MKHDNSVAMTHSVNLIFCCLKKRLHEQSKAKSYLMVRKSENFVVIVILISLPFVLMQTENLNFIAIWSGKYKLFIVLK